MISSPDIPRKLVVVTGATGGIGRATSLRLAGRGYDIVAQYRTRDDHAHRLRDEIEMTGKRCYLVQADLTTSEDTDRVAEEVLSLLVDPFVELWGLVNNAASLLGPGLSSATVEDFDRYVAVNVRAPFFLIQRLTPHMAKGACVVNVSSAVTRRPTESDIVYAMTKTALEGLTFHATVALARRSIRINNVLPGFTDNGHPAFQDPELRQHMADAAVLGDVGAPETVADGIAFLMSEAAHRTTGTTLDLSGGTGLTARSSGPSLRDLIDHDGSPS